MSSFLIKSMEYTMWVQIGLSLLVFLPMPRFLRKPIISGLENLLTQKHIARVYETIAGVVALIWLNSLYLMKNHQQKVRELLALEATGTGQKHALHRALEETKILMFTEQKNVYLSFFVLMLFFVVFTYIKSLKRDDELHDQLELVRKNNKGKTPGQNETFTTDKPKDTKSKKE